MNNYPVSDKKDESKDKPKDDHKDEHKPEHKEHDCKEKEEGCKAGEITVNVNINQCQPKCDKK